MASHNFELGEHIQVCDNNRPPAVCNMADTATTTGADGPEGESSAQRQARLRREKRQKKMAEEGEDRLAKIKALNGGVAPPAEVLGGRMYSGETLAAS